MRLEPRRKDPQGKVAAALRFNAGLGDPQAAYPSIQVAGTSGKGSVCALLSDALHAAGYRTGLHVSPYLQSFCEKTWIAGRHAQPSALLRALERVRDQTERFRADPECPASVHGLTSLALSYEAFREAEIEVAVMETGCGGRFDLVQGLEKALCVVSDLALDHQQALGETLEEIAWHKAGIFARDVPAVALRGPGSEVLEREAARAGAALRLLSQEDIWRGGALELPRLGRVTREDLGTAGGFPLRNRTLAALALEVLAERGWKVGAEHLIAASHARTLPARLEEIEPGVFLDGAHNPHKLAGCLEALAARGASPTWVVFGSSGLRAPEPLIAELARVRPRRLIATRLELYGKRTVPADELAATARREGLEALAIEPPEAALERALGERARGEPVLVTGSIYLVGRLRERWVPRERVILRGHSCPAATEGSG